MWFGTGYKVKIVTSIRVRRTVATLLEQNVYLEVFHNPRRSDRYVGHTTQKIKWKLID